MLRLGWKNRCFIRCGLRSKASMSVFLCGSLRRHTGGETTQNQHFLSSQKGGVGDGSFSHGKDQKLHGHVKPSSAGYVPVAESKGTSISHAVPARELGLPHEGACPYL